MRRNLITVSALVGAFVVATLAAEETWPARVLLTNDDGIEDRARLVELARALAPAEVHVAVPRLNRSGSTHFMTLVTQQRDIEVEQLEVEGVASFWVVDGFPADCVIFALSGPLKESPPDLVISGINGGANLGIGWLGSGTIGAARVAAILGVPALAVSGVDEDSPAAVQAVAAWTGRIARSDLVRNLEPGQYLTFGLPEKSPEAIRGVRVAPRAPLLLRLGMSLAENKGPGRQTWALDEPSLEAPPTGSDEWLGTQDYIVLTPMRADEHDYALLERMRAGEASYPAWPE